MLAAIAVLGRTHQVGQAAGSTRRRARSARRTGRGAARGAHPVPHADLVVPVGDWYATRLDRIDPLGMLWLVGLLVQFTLVWPLLLIGLRGLLQARGGRRVLRLVPAVLALAVVAALAGAVRARWGADPAELAFGSHVRAAEWLLGAAAGAAAAGLPARAPGRTAVWALTSLGIVGLVASGVVATLHRDAWLASGGPAAAAAAVAALLLAVHLDSGEREGPVARAVGRGFPAEMGRSAYTLLLLHAPVFWLVQVAVPAARPFALIAVGAGVAWIVGLLVQDGLLRRLRKRSAGSTLGIVTAVAAVLVAGGATFLHVADGRPFGTGGGPSVLVLGGAGAGDAAAALAGSRYTVIDATRSGCGLLPGAQVSGSPARPTALAQAPARTPVCTDPLGSWRAAVAAARPAAVVVDLSVDAAPRPASSGLPSACDPAFRPLYRELIADAVDTLTTGAPSRPILFTTVRDDTGHPDADAARGCLGALVVEAVASYPAVVPFDLDRPLCPGGFCRTVGEPGAPLLGDGVHLTDAGISALAAPLEERLAAELGADRTAARAREAGPACTLRKGGGGDEC